MKHDKLRLRRSIDERFAAIRTAIEQDGTPEMFRRFTLTMWEAEHQHFLKLVDDGVLTVETWDTLAPTLADRFLRMLRDSVPHPLRMEWAVFATRLATRQATHIPDWDAFYAARAKLEEKIDRGDLA